MGGMRQPSLVRILNKYYEHIIDELDALENVYILICFIGFL